MYSEASERIVFFDDMNFKVIKFDLLDKVVLAKTRLVPLLKFLDVRIQPERLLQIEGEAELVQPGKYLFGAVQGRAAVLIYHVL